MESERCELSIGFPSTEFPSRWGSFGRQMHEVVLVGRDERAVARCALDHGNGCSTGEIGDGHRSLGSVPARRQGGGRDGGLGALVALSARQRENAERAAEVISEVSGRKTLALAADVTVRRDVEEMIDTVLSALGRIDILVNNAGVNIRGPIEELSEDDWDTVVDTNLKGPWLCCRAVAPVMKSQKWGRVINVSSMLGEISMPGRSPYASSKGGLTLLTKTLALEWAKDGINVNALCPGPFATEINTPLLNDPVARAQMEANVPLARWGDPVELGPAAVFLASDASSFMTGATLFVDGGYTAR
jgi:NAD(P)-dependent dehydrogenase (short-subunit alcohol dehydrogenase family)